MWWTSDQRWGTGHIGAGVFSRWAGHCTSLSQHHGFGIEIVQALDAAHAQDITRAQHPAGRLSAVPAELLDGVDRHKLLAAWLRGKG
jgi:hypothetical protein